MASLGPHAAATSSDAVEHFGSEAARPLKAEIVLAGAKLWRRQYVDGNGGNISARLRHDAVVCTPTLLSKADLTPDDLCLVDLDGRPLAGERPPTSEILLHLEVYKAVPAARAVVHCHPPHATAYAITGRVPPIGILPEFEVFVGPVGLAPYETPGTRAFAETVLPTVKNHNTVLLSNHGVVCWADSVIHAEWCCEILDTYCWTLLVAQQLGAPLVRLSDGKVSELLDLKRRWGWPDARFGPEPSAPQQFGAPSEASAAPSAGTPPFTGLARLCLEEREQLVRTVTETVLRTIGLWK